MTGFDVTNMRGRRRVEDGREDFFDSRYAQLNLEEHRRAREAKAAFIRRHVRSAIADSVAIEEVAIALSGIVLPQSVARQINDKLDQLSVLTDHLELMLGQVEGRMS